MEELDLKYTRANNTSHTDSYNNNNNNSSTNNNNNNNMGQTSPNSLNTLTSVPSATPPTPSVGGGNGITTITPTTKKRRNILVKIKTIGTKYIVAGGIPFNGMRTRQMTVDAIEYRTDKNSIYLFVLVHSLISYP